MLSSVTTSASPYLKWLILRTRLSTEVVGQIRSCRLTLISVWGLGDSLLSASSHFHSIQTCSAIQLACSFVLWQYYVCTSYLLFHSVQVQQFYQKTFKFKFRVFLKISVYLVCRSVHKVIHILMCPFTKIHNTVQNESNMGSKSK